ncbi:energy-coupling factor transporter ATPase [Fodinisporobacter ferrooxydans]|uniref:Energy-coupling factor transporter ATPase n=1 Tax=Fodinisporobacter ferrooxydans TaxID=2901836 RepID=A0ABY4CSH9_9BACL|nr:energy-coupling factor transporter ATPase [Alicyclobacillaceae bacterium MYW30-H2]
MAVLEMRNVSFSYPDGTQALIDINLRLDPGDCVVICGASGSGKSTLLQMLKREIQPVGLATGEIQWDGLPFAEQELARTAQEIGMIFQDPENQIAMDEVWQELAFGLENMGLSTDDIRKRVAEIVHFFGIEDLLDRKTHELSGGQKQMVNLAAVLLMQPKILLLDEPTAQLDPIAAREFLQMMQRLNEELGMTIVLAEHRLEDVFALADRVLVMEHGQIKYEGTPKEVIRHIFHVDDTRFLPYLPSIAKLFLESLPENRINPSVQAMQIPVSVKEGRQWLLKMGNIRLGTEHSEVHLKLHRNVHRKEHFKKYSDQQTDLSSVLLELKHVYFQYQRDAKLVLADLNLSMQQQEWLAIVGGNGAGKTTLLQAAAGLLTPQKGTVTWQGKKLKKLPERERYQVIGYVAQNPKLYFVHDSVEQELRHVMQRFPERITEQDVQHMIARLRIASILQKHPYDCSGGEQQKVALAGVLLTKPQILLLDEPTKGLDPLSKLEFAQILEGFRQEGVAILMVTHDIEFAAAYATRCAMLFHGEITAEGTPREFFQGNYFYTTVIQRLFQNILPTAVTYEEVLAHWRGVVS